MKNSINANKPQLTTQRMVHIFDAINIKKEVNNDKCKSFKK